MSDFSPIGSLINSSLNRTGVSSHVESTLILDKFNDLCWSKWGQKAKNKVRAIYIKKKVLTVACLSSPIAQEINLNAHLFIKEINKEFGNAVERLRFLS